MKRKLSHFFLPSEANNFRALILKPSFLGIFIALFLLNQSLIKSFSLLKPGVLGYSSEITATKVLDQTNQQRIKLGLKALTFNPVLSKSAQAKAKDMFSANYWAHTSPTGVPPWTFFQQAGYDYQIAGENLAKDFYDTETLMKAWMNSPTHRANIVNTKYQEIGIAVVDGVLNGMKTTLVVQHFAAPLSGQVLSAEPVDETKIPDLAIPAVEPVSAPAPVINPLTISKVIGIIIFLIIISVMVIDSYITLKNNTPRLTGSSASHIGFLFIILMLLIFTSSGTIF